MVPISGWRLRSLRPVWPPVQLPMLGSLELTCVLAKLRSISEVIGLKFLDPAWPLAKSKTSLKQKAGIWSRGMGVQFGVVGQA